MGREQRDLGDRHIKEWVALASRRPFFIFCHGASLCPQCPPAMLNPSESPGTMENNLSEEGRGDRMGKRQKMRLLHSSWPQLLTTAP